MQLSKNDVVGSARRRTRSDAHSGARQEVFVAERGILGEKSVIFGGWPKGWPGKGLWRCEFLGIVASCQLVVGSCQLLVASW